MPSMMKIKYPLRTKVDAKNPRSPIEAGTICNVIFYRKDVDLISGQKITVDMMRIIGNGVEWNLLTSKGIKYFKKMPSMRMVEQWSNDSVCKSVLGRRVEPDGYDNSGSPSWLLVLGMI